MALLLVLVLGLLPSAIVFALWRRDVVEAFIEATPRGLRARGWGLLLLVQVGLFVLLWHSFAQFSQYYVLLTLGVILLIIFAPRTAARLVPWGLIVFGCVGYWTAKHGLEPDGVYGLVPAVPNWNSSWFGHQSPWLVPEAALFLGLGVWLFPRLDAPGSGLLKIMISRLRGGAGGSWALLLLPVLLMLMELAGLTHWFGIDVWTWKSTLVVDLAILAGALLLIYLRPDRAVAAALVGMGFLGVYGILLAGFWPRIPGGFFGAELINSRGTAVIGAGVQGVVLLAATMRLTPRIYRTEPDPELQRRAERLTERVQTLTQTRSDAVDTAVAELRRIERDLHDGAQARLVALGMSLQAAERLFKSSPEAALTLVSEAKEASSRALTELRDLVRGIYPPVLADRGLADAVKALALDTPLHTVVDIDLPGEVEMPVGSAVYFAVAEALTNAAKHSGARTIRIQLHYEHETLRAEVIDDGAGGVDPEQGTGLKGVERRLATFDGILAVSSPPGGPTIVVIEVPCALSSPKTSSC
ncbi:MAG TPA: histidine kinase [Streptosporangiaceae bacterium]